MIRDFIAIDFEMSQRALSQRAWHRVMEGLSVTACLAPCDAILSSRVCASFIYIVFSVFIL
jgi:hypothetical protein